MKSSVIDGDVASLSSYQDDHGKSAGMLFYNSSFSSCGGEADFMDKLNNATNNIKDVISNKDVKNMNNQTLVKQKPPESSKEDANGNDIQEPFDGCFNGSNGAPREENETDSVSLLSTRVEHLQSSLASLQEETDATIRKLRQELAAKAARLDTLQLQLQQQQRDKHELPLDGKDSLGGSLEILMNLQRAKAFQANPALRAFADLQGNPLSQMPPARGAIPGLDNFNVLNEDMLNSWRKSLEQSLLGQSPFYPPGQGSSRPAPDFPYNADQAKPVESPDTARSTTPLAERTTPSMEMTSQQTSQESKTPSEDGGISPPRATELEVSSGPIKDCDSPRDSLEPASSPEPTPVSSLPPLQCSPLPPVTYSYPTLVPQSQLTIPPLFTSRIPKSDPMEARLQDMLRYSMEKTAGQALDTVGDSRRVRELLSVHNIGQRLFAKYVLGLSQGTVSELLSKPKSWEKLTEKGRDSYRKMHAWAYDEQAIILLKSLIPRKGELMRSVSSFAKDKMNTSPRPEDRRSEERITKILNDAAGSPYGSLKQEDSKSPSLPSNQQVSENSFDVGSGKSYQEELGKVLAMGEEKPGGEGFHSLLFPSLPTGRSANDLQRTMELYQAEMSRLQRQQGSPRAPSADRASSSDGHVWDADKDDISESGKEGNTRTSSTPSPFTAAQTKFDQNFGSGRVEGSLPGTNPRMGGFFSPHGFPEFPLMGSKSIDSPLQRMASITNSLISQPMPSPHMHPQKIRSVLPPITQQQFDRFTHLNTDTTVRAVKEMLSQFSISQRLFGESILGLSQGSVSDLLARPKPWHMLTQKGREPFIRMKLFLEDEGAVHRLVASQYKIIPDKLMRTGAYSGNPILPASKMVTTNPQMPDPLRALTGSGIPPMIPMSGTMRFPGMDPRFSGMPGLDPLSLQRKLLGQRQDLPSLPPLTPNLFEMAAMTQELNTQTITTRIKEILLANNMGQKLFGEAVLGLSQGSVSELLSKPKPWHTLSIKGREPYVRMQIWLNDPGNVDKLVAMKNERRETNKRKRSGVDSSSDRSSPVDTSDVYSNPGGNESAGSQTGMADSPGSVAKKQRVLFTEEQKEALKIAFSLDPYPSTSTLEFLCEELQLESKALTNWFHNKRMRLKQQLPKGMDQLMEPREGHQFDPLRFKLIYNQRLIELHKEREEKQLEAKEKCLDLSFKRDDDENIESDTNEDSIATNEQDDGESDFLTDDNSQKQGFSSGGRSRRKPLAPQWVNPDWAEENNQPGKSLTINGVCVMNTGVFDEKVVKQDPMQWENPGEEENKGM